MDEPRISRSILLAIVLALTLFATATIARAEGKTHAILLNSGGGYTTNDPRYDAGLAEVYGALKARGVFPHDIHIISGNGNPDGIRSKEWSNKNPAHPTTLDYGRKDKKSAASLRSLNRVFNELVKNVKLRDQVVIALTGPATKERLSADTKLKLYSGETLSVHELQNYLKKLPSGSAKVVITDTSFGADFVKLNVKNSCGFSAFSSDQPGPLQQNYFKQFSETLKKDGATFRVADLRSNETGRDSLALWIEGVSREIKTPVAQICVDCTVQAGQAVASALEKGLARESRNLASVVSLEEMADVLIKEKPQYYDGDLKERVAYFSEESYASRLKKIRDSKTKYSQDLKRAQQNRAAENEGNRLREEKVKILTEEKALEKRYRDLLNELKFVLSAAPAQLQVYSEKKRCSQNAL
jgi:hypothetical protein